MIRLTKYNNQDNFEPQGDDYVLKVLLERTEDDFKYEQYYRLKISLINKESKDETTYYCGLGDAIGGQDDVLGVYFPANTVKAHVYTIALNNSMLGALKQYDYEIIYQWFQSKNSKWYDSTDQKIEGSLETLVNIKRYIEEDIVMSRDEKNEKKSSGYWPTDGYLTLDKKYYLNNIKWIRIEAPAHTKISINNEIIYINNTGVYYQPLIMEQIQTFYLYPPCEEFSIIYRYSLIDFEYTGV